MNKLKQKGSIALFVGFGLFLLIGILAITLEFGYMHAQKNKLQNVADAAALACLNLDSENVCGQSVVRNLTSSKSSGCTSIAPCGPLTLPSNTSTEISAINPHNFKIETKLPVSCPIPDTACAYAKATTTWQPIFLKYFMSEVTRSAEATAGGKRIGACFIVKEELNINGNMDVALKSCSAAIGQRLITTNSAGINIYIPGTTDSGLHQTVIYNNGINTCSPGECNPTPRIVADPFPDDPPYSYGSPTGTVKTGIELVSSQSGKNNVYELTPGQYPNGINMNDGISKDCTTTTVTIGGGKNATTKSTTMCSKIKVGPGDTVNFKPGTYYVTGDFYFSTSGTYSGDGVTFLVQNNSSNTGVFRVSGDSVTLKAPTTTTCDSNSDILILRKPTNATGTFEIKGNNSLNLEGVIYFPNDNLNFSGSSATVLVKGTVIAKNLSTNGNVRNETSPNNCFNKGTRYKVSLVY